jgi:hypothetical protein
MVEAMTSYSKCTPIIILTQKANIIRMDFGQFGPTFYVIPTFYIIPNRSLVVEKSKINEIFSVETMTCQPHCSNDFPEISR